MSGTVSLSAVALVQVALIVLKLYEVIKWHWLWVLFPTWLVTGFAFMFVFIIACNIWLEE